jgi:hypothetical protein
MSNEHAKLKTSKTKFLISFLSLKIALLVSFPFQLMAIESSSCPYVLRNGIFLSKVEINGYCGKKTGMQLAEGMEMLWGSLTIILKYMPSFASVN